MRRILTALGLVVTASVALAGGKVEISFKPVADLADAGNDRFDGERNVKALAEHFEALGARLHDGQLLKIEVLDLDLAGTMKPTRRGSDIRVLRGGADWPTMTLRWSLAADGRTLDSGDERVSDMAYMQRPLGGRDSQPLVYEKRMIERWFDSRFGAASAR